MRVLVGICALLAVACQPEQETVPGTIEAPEGEVIGTVDGHPITQEMVDAVTERMPPEQLDRMKAMGQYQTFLDRIALGQVLYRQALDKGLHDDPEVKAAIAMAARDVLASEMVEEIGEAAVTDEKVKETYEAHAVQFARPQVKARHIVVKEQGEAADLKAQLEGGASFEELAAEHSIDPGTKDKGGDLGWFEKQRMFAGISEPAFAAEKGAILGPIETRMGYHVVLVEDKRDSTPLEDVRPQLEEMVKQEAVEAYITELEEAAKIEWTTPAEGAPALDAEIPTPPPAGGHGPGDGHGH